MQTLIPNCQFENILSSTYEHILSKFDIEKVELRQL